jgi:hypothetical protein
MPLPLRAALAVAMLLCGAVTGLAAVAVHGRPWGLALGLAATLATTLALPRGWSTRFAFVVGWAGLVVYAAQTRPEGDYAIAANGAGFTLLVAAFVLVLVGVVTLPQVRRGGDAREPAPPPGRP